MINTLIYKYMQAVRSHVNGLLHLTESLKRCPTGTKRFFRLLLHFQKKKVTVLITPGKQPKVPPINGYAIRLQVMD